MMGQSAFFRCCVGSLVLISCSPWTLAPSKRPLLCRGASSLSAGTSQATTSTHGNLHGQNACFLPLKQLDQDYHSPRIIQIAGAYPGLSFEEFNAVKSQPSAAVGQWGYDFSDPQGPQLGTVALEGSLLLSSCEDPVAIIAEHTSLGLQLPNELVDPVDLIALVDRSLKTFTERYFLVIKTPECSEVTIEAYASIAELPAGGEILGHVLLVQVPWLPRLVRSSF